MNSKTCLVLGGGSGQLALIERLKSKNVRVVLQDRNAECPARGLTDYFVQADTVDSDSAAEAAVAYEVSAVITAGTDQPVLAGAAAAAKRGCPSLLSEECALAVTDKEVMKTRLRDSGIETPRFCFAGSESGIEILDGIEPPFVLKPVDSQGQRGVVLLKSPEDFLKYRDNSLKWSRRKRLVVEEYHPNREITVSGWVYRGKVSIWAVTDRVTKDFNPHIGICMAHRYPSVYAAGREKEVRELTEKCTGALGIENGPIYFQYLITDNGIHVNETAARLGGAYEDLSLPPVCGIDLIEILIAGSFDGEADPVNEAFRTPVRARSFAVPLMFCKPGIVTSGFPEEPVRDFPGVTSFNYLLKPGTIVTAPENSVQRAAYVVVHGKNSQDVNRTLKRIWPRMQLKDSMGRQSIRNTIGYALNPG